MENKLEQLLISLIDKGWKPNWKEYNHVHAEYNRIMSDFGTFYRFCNIVEDGSINRSLNLKLREIVSKESGLWQFVCENGMINVPHPNKGKYPRDKLEREQYKYWDRTIGYYGEDNLDRMGYSWDRYQFRLIESALKDESELEDFLLQNIKVDEKDNM